MKNIRNNKKNIIERKLIKSGVQNIIKLEEEFYIEYNVNFTINTFFPEKHNFKKTKKGLVKFLETSVQQSYPYRTGGSSYLKFNFKPIKKGKDIIYMETIDTNGKKN